MITQAENLNILWGKLIVEELVRNGVTYFCISPGSRSTPLTVAAARNAQAKTMICLDERGSAFHALGYARGTGLPAALITTSGTAVGNCLPAIIEASMDMVPMIVITADRPPELRETGANQTIHQTGIFERYVRYEFDMPCPSVDIPANRVLNTVDLAVFRACATPAGPVHINCMFREPLEPRTERIPADYITALNDWNLGSRPWTSYMPPSTTAEDLNSVAEAINQADQGLVIAGHLAERNDREAVAEFSKRVNWPVFADIRSGLRIGHSEKNIIAYYDQMLLSDKIREIFRPDVVVHMGGVPVSKRFLQFMEKLSPSEYIMINDHPFRHDPAGIVTRRIQMSVRHACQRLYDLVSVKKRTDIVRILKIKSDGVGEIIEKNIQDRYELNEPGIARYVSRIIPEGTGLFLANSMPVRDMDMFAYPECRAFAVAVNRGASGIDGTIASAAGFATGLGRPVTLLTGDLSFIHDLNSLFIIKSARMPVVIIVINNGGGGIFSFLPISRHKDVFEKFFATPHNLTFEHAAAQFDIDYHLPSDMAEFVSIYSMAITKNRPSIIEVQTNRNDNIAFHRHLQEQITEALEK